MYFNWNRLMKHMTGQNTRFLNFQTTLDNFFSRSSLLCVFTSIQLSNFIELKSVVRPNVKLLISVPCPTIISASLISLFVSYLNFTEGLSHHEEQEYNQVNKIKVKIKLIINKVEYITCVMSRIQCESLHRCQKDDSKLTGFIA